jgi:hypothetical protein
MESPRMKNAAEIILEIKGLPPEERQKVADYLNTYAEEEFSITKLSPEDMALLDQDEKEYRQGINTSGPFYGKDVIAHLDSL